MKVRCWMAGTHPSWKPETRSELPECSSCSVSVNYPHKYVPMVRGCWCRLRAAWVWLLVLFGSALGKQRDSHPLSRLSRLLPAERWSA